MFNHKVTQTLLAFFAFFVILSAGVVVSDDSFGSRFNQLASVGSSENKGDVPNSKDYVREGGEGTLTEVCQADPVTANGFTHYNDFGSGSVDSPYEIWTAKQFADISSAGMDPYHYLQCLDINLGLIPQFTIPQFVGHYNGNYKYLEGYKYNGPGGDFIGMFEQVSNGALLERMKITAANMQLNVQASPIAVLVGKLNESSIEDVKLYNSSVVAPFASAAALVGQSYLSEIRNIEVNNTVVRAKYNAAGLVNFSINSSLENIKISGGTVLAVSGKAAGVVNSFYSGISFKNISYKGSGVNGIDVGGIVNNLENSTLSFATVEAPLGSVASADNHTGIGGVVWQAYNSTIEKTHFDNTLTRNAQTSNPLCGASDFAGGVVGSLINSSVYWSYASGFIRVTNNCGGTGGIAGNAMNSTIQNSYADVGFVVTGSNNTLGGLVGTTMNTDNSLSSYFKNRTMSRFMSSNGGTLNVLGSHLGVVVGSNFPSDMSYTGGALFSATFATGPYVGVYENTSGGNSISTNDYYIESYQCTFANCNNLGTPKSQPYLLNPVNLPMQTWEFAASKWVQTLPGLFPTIPSAKSN